GLPQARSLPRNKARIAAKSGVVRFVSQPERPAMRVGISFLALLFLSSSLAWAQPEDHSADEQTLASFGLATDGQSLLDFFRGRSRLESDRERLLELTRQLGEAAADVCVRASAELIAPGPVAITAHRHSI